MHIKNVHIHKAAITPLTMEAPLFLDSELLLLLDDGLTRTLVPEVVLRGLALGERMAE